MPLFLTLYLVFVNSVETEQVNGGWGEPLKKGVFDPLMPGGNKNVTHT